MNKLTNIVVEKSQGFNSANKYSASQLDGKLYTKVLQKDYLQKLQKYDR